MKQLFSMLLVFMVSNVSATVHTVSNNPANVAQFNTIQDAISRATNGDTIYVHGSPVTYTGFTIISKRLVIIGPGWAPDKNLPARATVVGFTLGNTTDSVNSANGTTIIGLVFVSTGGLFCNIGTNVARPLPVNNIVIQRCEFFRTRLQITALFVFGTNYLVEGNYFNESFINKGTGFLSNLTIRNNVFRRGALIPGGISVCINDFSVESNVVVDHNLFYGSNNDMLCFNNCSQFVISNNLFVRGGSVLSANSTFNTFNNNLTFQTTTNTPWVGNNNVDGGGNLANRSPDLFDQAAVESGTDNPLLNFEIRPPSVSPNPAFNGGNDGKNIGLLFDATGSNNWTNSRNARIPRVYSMSILNGTVPPGGTLNVTVEARKSN